MTDKMVTPHYEREPENAPGPFHVEKDRCITCSLPVETAPETPEEISRMIEVVVGSCIAAYRYCGTEPEILRRLVEAGCKAQCDALVPRRLE